MSGTLPLSATLQFSPMIAVFVPQAKQNAQTFNIKNAGSEDIAVRVKITTRAVDELGEETREDASSLFSVYPSQAILKAGEERLVRVTWKGGSVGSREQAYRIIAEQLPVDFSGTGGEGVSVAVNMQFKYEGSLYVSPRNAAPRIVSSILRNSDGAFLVLENSGSGHLVMLEPVVIIRGPGGAEYRIPDSELEPIRGRNILAGGRRVLPIRLPAEFQDGSELRVVFSSKKE